MPCAPAGSLARPPYDFLRTDVHGHPHTCTHCGEPLTLKMVGHNDSTWVTADCRGHDDFGEPPDYPGLGFPHPMIPWFRFRPHEPAPCPDPHAPALPGAGEPAPECCGPRCSCGTTAGAAGSMPSSSRLPWPAARAERAAPPAGPGPVARIRPRKHNLAPGEEDGRWAMQVNKGVEYRLAT